VVFLVLNCGDTIMAENIWPHPPDSSTISTCVASRVSMSFEVRDSGVTPEFGGCASVIFGP